MKKNFHNSNLNQELEICLKTEKNKFYLSKSVTYKNMEKMHFFNPHFWMEF